jgi:hypothetical protein
MMACALAVAWPAASLAPSGKRNLSGGRPPWLPSPRPSGKTAPGSSLPLHTGLMRTEFCVLYTIFHFCVTAHKRPSSALSPRKHRQQKGVTAAAPPALAEDGVRGGWCRELLHGLAEAIAENARPRRTGPILERKQCCYTSNQYVTLHHSLLVPIVGLCNAEETGGHPVGHVRADGTRHG